MKAGTAISIGNTKEGALYFDNVVQGSWILEFLAIADPDDPESNLSDYQEGMRIGVDLSPAGFRANKEFMDLWGLAQRFISQRCT